MSCRSGCQSQTQRNTIITTPRLARAAVILNREDMSKKSELPGIKYRLNVAAILRNDAGELLIGERVDRSGAWQFPQGGVDGGETLAQALTRELQEEISLEPSSYTIQTRKGPYFYLFGNGKVVKGFHGKEQHYFLADFTGDPAAVNVRTPHPEFSDIRWVEPAAFKIEWLPKMKREVYREVFRDFFSIQI
jgi:putative (di)nucleoside polyphosphate hydrolase